MTVKILVIDDDPVQCRLLESQIKAQNFECFIARSGKQGIDILLSDEAKDYNVVLLDLGLPDIQGIDVLKEARPKNPSLPFVILTANGSVNTVVEAMQSGAVDFIVKPASPERLKVSISNAIKVKSLQSEIARLKKQVESRADFDDLIANSHTMAQTLKLARRAAQSNIPILIDGESGVGKEVMARAIQGGSNRAGKPFIAVNCGAMPDNLVESILFGHEKGAFTGATDRHIGKFQEAHGGTLFLDEIGELKLDIQVKLLRALQEGEIDRVGGSKPIKVDVRIISATNKDLYQLVEENTFREDLYYRLNVFQITLPPLRERREDIESLSYHFLQKFAAEEEKNVTSISDEAMQVLSNYHWPGNIRQLENMIFRAVVMAENDCLELSDFPKDVQNYQKKHPVIASTKDNNSDNFSNMVATIPNIPHIPLLDNKGHIKKLIDVETQLIEYAFKHYSGQMSEIARKLGIGRSTLYRRMRDLGMEFDEAG
jgi:DNA-binding NtrC family response regulator